MLLRHPNHLLRAIALYALIISMTLASAGLNMGAAWVMDHITKQRKEHTP